MDSTKKSQNHVFFNQPKTFAEADSIIRLRPAFAEAVLSLFISENQTFYTFTFTFILQIGAR